VPHLHLLGGVYCPYAKHDFLQLHKHPVRCAWSGSDAIARAGLATQFGSSYCLALRSCPSRETEEWSYEEFW